MTSSSSDSSEEAWRFAAQTNGGTSVRGYIHEIPCMFGAYIYLFMFISCLFHVNTPSLGAQFLKVLEIVHPVRQGTKTEVLDVWAFALSQEDKKKAEDWGTYHQRGQELSVSFFAEFRVPGSGASIHTHPRTHDTSALIAHTDMSILYMCVCALSKSIYFDMLCTTIWQPQQ